MDKANTYEHPTLNELLPYFIAKKAAMRHRKAILQMCAELTWNSQDSCWDDSEAEAEKARILASFGKREPANLGEDFLAHFHWLMNGGTAIRRNRKRELKRLKRLMKAGQ